ncbi:hypothetical protein [Microbacterium hominis]|uniref:hypothetical protein n=1 Tax=Microbacterium hominis TaxID=162426 RepID=UPI001CC2C2D2|nr:hypothetical protein [Microbacterium hominis]
MGDDDGDGLGDGEEAPWHGRMIGMHHSAGCGVDAATDVAGTIAAPMTAGVSASSAAATAAARARGRPVIA